MEEEVKNYQILLIDKVKREVVETSQFTTNNLEFLKEKLLLLQEGYCEDEKPECFEKVFGDGTGKQYSALCAESDCDFAHVAPLIDLIKVKEK